MAITPGSRIGPYEVTGSIGAGGMGEVYRAHDSRLHRDVALKVLPETFASDPDRLARFRREAQVLASLNHPNIAAIHGLEESADQGVGTVLVLELVEGPTLADRLAPGALAVDEALRIARQVADALEAAHERGVVHRDLKPANIKVRDDGTVKVLDFGLAKAFDSENDSRAPAVTQTPTLTSPAMTRAGIILGTAAYMAPEQARGKNVDKRADIWAFGVVLFESLTGQRLFAGSEVSDTLAFVLTKEPDWASLPASTPAPIHRLLRRCLQKDRTKRLADISDARLEIDEALEDPSGGVPSPVANPPVPRWRRTAPWAVATIAIVGAGLTAGLTMWTLADPAAPSLAVRVRADLGTTDTLATAGGAVVMSPDGTAVAFVARRATELTARNTLHVRRLDRLDTETLPGTEGAFAPFFSPDGQWIAFFADGALKKVPAGGGGVVSLGDAPSPRGGWWSEDNTVVFASAGGLRRMSAAGGQTESLTELTPGGYPSAFPQVLPGGRAVVYSEVATDNNASKVVVRPLPSGDPKVVAQGGISPRYVASGHLTFVRSGTLFAVPFDLEALEPRGNAVPVVENIPTVSGGGTLVSASATGVLAYQPGSSADTPRDPIVWLDRTGSMAPLRSTPATWGFPRFSPDGRRLAMTIYDGRQTDIWVYDWERDILTRITSEPSVDISPVWTPNGTRLVFASNRGGVSNLYWQRADGTGEAQRLTESTTAQIPDSFHPDGRQLAFHEGDPTTGRQSLTILTIEGDEVRGWKPGTPSTFVGGPFLKASPRFSPDGRWLSYAAFDSGGFEIYVQPFPGPGARVQVSNDGGNLALWSPIRNELYFAGGSQSRMMVVPYTTAGNVFTPAKAQPWSEVRFSATPPISAYGPGFDIHPSGQRFAVAPPVAPASTEQPPSQLVFIFNFFDELRRLAPLPQ